MYAVTLFQSGPGFSYNNIKQSAENRTEQVNNLLYSSSGGLVDFKIVYTHSH